MTDIPPRLKLRRTGEQIMWDRYNILWSVDDALCIIDQLQDFIREVRHERVFAEVPAGPTAEQRGKGV